MSQGAVRLLKQCITTVSPNSQQLVTNKLCHTRNSNSVSSRLCADLTDVTLADEDTNPILTDNANRAFQRNVAKQVTQAGGKMCN